MNGGRSSGLRGALPWLAALVAAVAAAVAIAVVATRARIDRNESAQVLKVLRELLPAGGYDNRPDEDCIRVAAPALLGSSEALPVYRARLAGQPVAAIMTVVARQGYVGPIRLLVSVAADGRVLAVRAIAHQETPGLGDRIDAAKSGWIGVFTGRSLDAPAPDRWAVRRDGGDFDQITGATVTSRAVVTAVHGALEYFRTHRAEILDAPAACRATAAAPP